MNHDPLSGLLRRLELRAEIFKHARYCGAWAVDTSGMRMAPFHLIQQGNCWLHMDGRPPAELTPGDLVILPRDSGHVVSASADRPARNNINRATDVERAAADNVMLCGFFEFGGRIAWPVLDSLPDAVIVRRGESGIDALVSLIFDELDGERLGSYAVLEFLAHALFVQVIRAAARQGFEAGLLSALADPKLGPVLGRIHAEPERPWTLAELADAATLSRTAFAEQFRNRVGEPPMRYLNLWRLQVARDLLLGSDLSVAQVAERVGYTSDVSFRQKYRQEMGMTPSAARRAARSQSKNAGKA